ncbi:MAG: caspase domain-containing protein [Gemmatimonadaceae bacterium]
MTAPPVNQAGTRRALLIGVQEYRHISNLGGCVNDARLMESVLRNRFDFTHCTRLENEEATRAGILLALDTLAEETRPGDVVVFYFAGHGSQRVDREGDEPSGFDSTLMPVDTWGKFGTPEQNLDITDDEIFLWLERLAAKTSAITVIVDACHSGTITRDAEFDVPGFAVRGLPPDSRPPTVPSPIPPELWPRFGGGAGTRRAEGGARRDTAAGWLPLHEQYVLMSGCRDEELSGEFLWPLEDGSTARHGALTFFLARALQRATAGTTYRSVFEDVAAKVTQVRQGKQHPQMEGKGDRVLFGLDEMPPMRYVRLAGVNDAGTAVTLAAGAALGVTLGTAVALYPADTVSTDAKAPLARATVTEVRPFDSTAVLIEASITGDMATAARAVLTPILATDVRRPVRIDQAAAALVPAAEWAAMTTLLGETTVVRLVDQPEPSAITVTAWPAERTGTGPSWMLTGADGQPVAPPKLFSETMAVVHNLTVLARQALAMTLDNPDPASALARQRPTMQLLRKAPDGSWRLAEPAAGGLPVFQEGEFAGVRIVNPTDQPLYFALLMFGLSGKVMPLYPPEGATEFLAAGPPVDLFTLPGRGMRVVLPNVYPFEPGGTLPVRDEGQGTLKLFVTTTPASFAFLHERDGVRSGAPAPPPDSALQLLFEQQLGATRDFMPEEPAGPIDDWTTVVVSYVVRRAPA